MPYKPLYPVLIFVTNNYQAVWFRLDEENKNKLQIIDKIIDQKEQYSDAEGTYKTRSGGATIRSGSAQDKNEEHRHETQQHLTKCGVKTQEFWNTHIYHKLFVVTPRMIKNQVKNELKKTIPNTELEFILGNFISEPSHKKLLSYLHNQLHSIEHPSTILIGISS